MQQQYNQYIQALNSQQQSLPNQSHLFQAQRMQEEMRMKSNLDYENRLREHMYQFEDPDSIKEISPVKKAIVEKDDN